MATGPKSKSERDLGILIYDKDDPFSVYNLVSEEFRQAMDAIPDYMKEYGEKGLDNSKALNVKDYQLRIKDSQKHYYSYVKSFSTSGDWETVTIDLADMYPSLMGQHLNMPNFDQSSIAEIAFLISNKVAEDFELIIKEIKFI